MNSGTVVSGDVRFGQKCSLNSTTQSEYSEIMGALTNGDFFDELSSSVCPLHERARPGRQIPVALNSKDMGFNAPACPRSSGEHQVRTLGRRTTSTARMNQPRNTD